MKVVCTICRNWSMTYDSDDVQMLAEQSPVGEQKREGFKTALAIVEFPLRNHVMTRHPGMWTAFNRERYML